MKKTLVALSVLAAAANVNAAELYSAEGSSVSLKGEVDVYLKQSEVDQTATTGRGYTVTTSGSGGDTTTT